MEYDREAAVAYAHAWALGRNPQYMSLNGIGGDCTNFISQCIRAGGAPMNTTPDLGWYYHTPNDRAAAWTSVEHLFRFLTTRHNLGPYGVETTLDRLLPGDIIQLSFRSGLFSHTLMVVSTKGDAHPPSVLVAAHSDDSDNRPLSTYWAVAWRYLQIGLRP